MYIFQDFQDFCACLYDTDLIIDVGDLTKIVKSIIDPRKYKIYACTG